MIFHLISYNIVPFIGKYSFQKSFEMLEDVHTNSHILINSDPDKTYILFADASE